MDEDGGAFSGMDPTAVTVLKGNVNSLLSVIRSYANSEVNWLTSGPMLILANWFKLATC